MLMGLCILDSGSQAQPPVRDSGAPAFLEEARKYVIESTRDRSNLKLNEKSLLNWTNPTRQQERGAIYVWTHEERPLAIGSLFTYELSGKVHMKHEFHSLSTGALNASYNGTTAWTPTGAGLQWQAFVDGPAPKETHGNRSLQMRQLARVFRAELISPKHEKNELRLAPRPLFEYSSPKAGVMDGAIFSFVVATDPEVLLLIEAFEENRDGGKTSGFRYAFARFHYWNVIALDGERRVWEAPLDKAHELNYLGDRENISKVYNSFHPRRSAEEQAGAPK
ncbi:MAG: hypothetical protein H7062_01735 [Candidatus Saccharimonas sp.]|nr:hypothetical protein [Planctomycetaceae bacterium]